ncbi:MAG: hypothetical protein U0573_15795 [Phycisphaerales bacterium]
MALSLSITGFGKEPRDAIAEAAGIFAPLGEPRLQLDATMAGIRPRELDRSGRRDLAALLRRSGVFCSGLDVLIPGAHFSDSAQADRALSAAVGAVELLAELGTLGAADSRVLCITLPEKPVAGVVEALSEAARDRAVLIADLSAPGLNRAPIGPGLDCVRAIVAGADPVAAAAAGPLAVRLCDWDGTQRVAPGARGGRLDLRALRGALSVSAPSAAVIVDVAGMRSPREAAMAGARAWREAGVAA